MNLIRATTGDAVNLGKINENKGRWRLEMQRKLCLLFLLSGMLQNCSRMNKTRYLDVNV